MKYVNNQLKGKNTKQHQTIKKNKRKKIEIVK